MKKPTLNTMLLNKDIFDYDMVKIKDKSFEILENIYCYSKLFSDIE